MSDWFIKTILHPSRDITLPVLVHFLKQMYPLAEIGNRMPIVEIRFEENTYLLVRESDFRERLGE